MHHRLKKFAIAGAATLLLLEIVLQALALAAWLASEPEQPHADATERVVLCVGDSFTYGSGASRDNATYPRQLQHMLRARGEPKWRVVNGGQLGRDSRGALEVIDQQLAAYRPEVVCIVIGTNDIWTRPRLLELTGTGHASAPGFRWELRTLRFLKLFRSIGLFRSDPPPKPAGVDLHPDLVGSWSATGGLRTLVFAEDGTCRMLGQTYAWRGDGSVLSLSAPHLSVEFATERIPEGWLLRLTSGESAVPPVLLTPAETSAADPDALGDLAASRGDWPAAAAAYTEARDTTEPDTALWIESTVGLVRALFQTGADDRAEDVLRELEAFHARHDSEDSLAALLRAVTATRDWSKAASLAEEGCRAHPTNNFFWLEHTWATYWGDDPSATLASLQRTLENTRPDNLRRHALWEMRANLLAQEDPESLPRCLVSAWVDTESEELFEKLVSIHSLQTSEPDLRAACAAEDLSPADSRRLVATYRRIQDRPSYHANLRSHLTQLAQRIRRSGAHPVIGDYPFRNAELEATLRSTAGALGVPFVSVSGAFRKVIADDPVLSLFVTDGHCNDDGYALMAKAMSQTVSGLVR